MHPKLVEFLAGCRDEAPLQLGVLPFGMICGIASLAAGMPAWLAQLASAIVFSGAAQLVIVQMLAVGSGAAPIGLTAGLLGVRHVLYSVSLADYVRHLPRRWRLLLAYLLTDEAYAIAILRYQAQTAAVHQSVPGTPPGNTAPGATGDAEGSPVRDLRHWYFFGCGLTLWLTWQVSTAIGIVFGATIPADWDIDFAVPLTFIALLTLLIRERANQAAATAAALGALLLAALPYNLGLVGAIILGLMAGALSTRLARRTRLAREASQ